MFEIIATFAKNRVFNYKMVVYGGIGGVVLLSGEVWIHHLFTSGMPDWIRLGMMVSTLMISVPVGLLMIGLIGTLYRVQFSILPDAVCCRIYLSIPDRWIDRYTNAMTAIDLYIHDTHFIVGHFHYVMAVSGTFAIFGSVFYLFPKMTGRCTTRRLER